MSRTVADRVPGSFRDPAGFVFRRDGVLYRQINQSFADEWTRFEQSVLAQKLVAEGMLVPWEEAPLAARLTNDAAAVVRPKEVPVLSFPYEWAFSQLQDAALLTLRIQQLALDAGWTLRDATPFNVQFFGPKPIWIDTLSFSPLNADEPWIAYRQFCESFLAPLALMAFRDVRLGTLLRDHLDGVPLDLAARLLPWRTRLSPGLAAHIHLHSATERRTAPGSVRRGTKMGMTRHRALVDHLIRVVRGLVARSETKWASYSTTTSYTEAAAEAKVRLVSGFLTDAGGDSVVDLGANDGTFSRIAAAMGRRTVAVDSDWTSIDRLYRSLRDTEDDVPILPLVVDITNPSSGVGWANAERPGFRERLHADAVLALALVHHLAIGHNLPLPMIVQQFAEVGRTAVVEFVPKEDPMTRQLLAARDDVFPDYDIQHFRDALSTRFRIVREAPIPGSLRTLLLGERLPS